MSVVKWRIYCNTDSKWVEGYIQEGTNPSVCFENNTHDINVNSYQILETISETVVDIKEEYTPIGQDPTSSRFRSDGFEISIPADTTIIKDFSWPYPIVALILRFVTETIHKGDYINCYGKPTTYIGNLSSDITSNTNILPVRTTTGFSLGMSIVITDSVNTESLGKITNINSGNSTITVQNNTANGYYKNSYISYYNPVGYVTSSVSSGDYEITCSSTVIQNVTKGMILYIQDSTHREKLGEIFQIDTNTNKITIQDPPEYSYITGSYLFVQLHMIKNYKIGAASEHVIGAGKIGGSYVTKFHVISLEYTNKNLTEQKDFNWYTEVLY